MANNSFGTRWPGHVRLAQLPCEIMRTRPAHLLVYPAAILPFLPQRFSFAVSTIQRFVRQPTVSHLYALDHGT